ncbi:hypothetical protein S40285_06922 [Stachybotrys chlorohalonatus IBT 40285]|uniref:Uncharacterized protein n=1 Tax=Stachybotrys chlorohalonatus (strain IBT 40285) TaxID=1283841 RepID=A0A084QH12_STAC4|nr:hypothetical protein S40285_06922 [Stachybotrys chlorohalonata IBT 40285]
MAATDSPTTGMGDTGFRIVLLPTLDEVDSHSENSSIDDAYHSDPHDASSIFQHDHEPTSPAELSSHPEIPTHPIPSLQDAFEESLREVTYGGAAGKPKLGERNPQARREQLLDQDRDDAAFDAVWRYRPGQAQHEVIKLVAQITFGVYLLLNGLANDNAQVIGILQGHIDEVDEFLEVALEDMAQAATDMRDRMDLLQLPMANMDVLGDMLEDPNFRSEMMERNEKIDHILARTNIAMRQWDDDIDAGLRCSTAFQSWLISIKDNPSRAGQPQLEEIYEAMKGNAEGWLHAFDEMNSRIQVVNEVIIRLMTVLAEMEKKTGEVTRLTWRMQPTSPRFTFPIPAKQHEAALPVASPVRLSMTSPRSPDATAPPSTATPKIAPLSRTPGSLRSVHSLRKSAPRLSVRSISSASAQRPKTRSGSISSPQANVNRLSRSNSISTVRAIEVDIDADTFDIEDLNEFPLPGSTPLLPPATMNKRPGGRTGATPPRPRIDTTDKILMVEEVEEPQEDMYILQPRTYTPKPPPTPVSPPLTPMTPILRDAIALAAQLEAQRQSFQPVQKRSSLRQRVSVKASLPEAIHIPSAAEHLTQRSRASVASPATATSQVQDSAYGSDIDNKYRRPPRMASHSDMSNPLHRMSPMSEQQQFYRPVLASPHSPLQQRPHTAVPHESGYRPSASYPQYLRSQPSRLGGMSMLSTVTASTYNDGRTGTATVRTQPGDKSLKKKKSAFGWFKKAFSLDEEEKAAFEARKALRFQESRQDPHSPKFLDGKRLR